MRGACITVVLALALAVVVGCGQTTSDPSGSPEQAGGAGEEGGSGGSGGSSGTTESGVVPDGVCQTLGVSYREGCDDCPEPIDCPCFAGDYLVAPLQRCSAAGHCTLGVNCESVCAGSEAPFGSEEYEHYLGTLETLTVCLVEPVCQTDDWCGEHEKCVEDPAGPLGRCATGEVGDSCVERDDCWSNICVYSCRDGAPGSGCLEDSDCVKGTCATVEGGVGFCTTGAVGEACDEANGCGPGTFCVQSNSTYGSGDANPATCRAGAVGEACDEPKQCQSGICLDFVCSSGELDSGCLEDVQCLSGFCLEPEGSLPNQHYTCGSGALGSPCYDDHNCAEGMCALRSPGDYGLCSTGEAGTFCNDDADCLSGTCTGAAPTQGQCDGKTLGDACGEGVCDVLGLCHFAQCE